MQPVIDPFVATYQSSIPGLPLLLQPERLAALLIERLPAAEGRPRQLVLEPTYLRFKPDTSCLVTFRCIADDRAFVCYAKALGKVNAVKLDKARRRTSVGGPLGPGVIIFAEQLLVVYFFPNDAALRGLSHLISDARQIKTLAYKAERRHVGLLGQGTANPTIVKLYKRSAFDRACALAKIAHRIPILPDLASVDAKNQSLQLHWIAGQTLAKAIQQHEPETAIHHCGVSAALLARLHAHVPPNDLAKRTCDMEQQQIRSLASGLVSLCPHLLDRVEGIAERLNAGLGLRPTRPVLIHGDFYANQVLLTPQGARLLDCDELALGARESDIGLFIAHLHLDVLRGRLSSEQCDTFASAFIDAYLHDTPADNFLIELYTLIGLFQLSHRPFRDMMHLWPTRIEKWLETIHVRLNRLLPNSPRYDVASKTQGEHAQTSGTHLLQIAMDRAEGLAEVERALAAAAPGTRQLHVQQVQMLRHKPGRRAVLRYDLGTVAGSTEMRALGKMRTKGVDVRTFALNQRLFDIIARSPALYPLQVPRPLATVPTLSMWLQQWIDGADGWQVLAAPDAVHSAAMVGEALYRLHNVELPTNNTHTWRDELGILEKRLALAAAAKPHQRARISALLNDCTLLARRLNGREMCGIHRDFYPDQVLLRDGRVYMLDMDLYCTGDPAIDIGNFVAHVQERDLRVHGDPCAHRKCYQTFTDTYCALSTDRWLPFAADAYRVLTLARHVYISTQFADRQSFVTDILSFCESEIRTLLSEPSKEEHLRENQQ